MGRAARYSGRRDADDCLEVCCRARQRRICVIARKRGLGLTEFQTVFTAFANFVDCVFHRVFRGRDLQKHKRSQRGAEGGARAS